jgi:hypothetical protein
MEKLRALYLKYLRHNLPKMKKDQLVDVIAPLLAKALNLENEGQAEVIRESLVNDMNRNPDMWSDDEKRTVLQGDEAPPALPDGESDEDMYTPQSLEQAIEYIKAIPTTDEILQEDIDNAAVVMEQLYPFLFTTEMPSISIIDDTLVFGWSKDKKGLVVIFTDDYVIMQSIPAHGGQGESLMQDEEGKLESEELDKLLKEIHRTVY